MNQPQLERPENYHSIGMYGMYVNSGIYTISTSKREFEEDRRDLTCLVRRKSTIKFGSSLLVLTSNWSRRCAL
jgi:hypothetical protein